MNSINTDVQSLVNLSKSSQAFNLNNLFNKQPCCVNGNECAFNIDSNLMSKIAKFDNVMDNVASFKDLVSTAQNGVKSMMTEGNTIRSLLEKARNENLSPESLDALEQEVNKRIELISNLKNETEYQGVFPFKGPVSLNIPNWQDVFTNGLFTFNESTPVEEENSEQKEELQNVLAEINLDMSFNGVTDGGKFDIGASAKIQIGYNDDGSLQIIVDASMDFDLSEITKNGIKSDESYDMINKFLEFLNGLGFDLGNASNMFDNMLASGVASISGEGFDINATNDINIEKESSSSLKGQIVQHAAITLNSTANQSPSIAINLL